MHAQKIRSARCECGCICMIFAYAFVVFWVFAELCDAYDVFKTCCVTYI